MSDWRNDNSYRVEECGGRTRATAARFVFNGSSDCPHEVGPGHAKGAAVRFKLPETAIAFAERTPERWTILPTSRS
jgi:hypothetical protein